MSAFAFNAALCAGIALQAAALLLARRADRRTWLYGMGAAAGIPAIGLAVAVLRGGGPEEAAAGALWSALIAAFGCGSILVARLPPRVDEAALLSLTLTFWAAVLPVPRPWPLWLLPAGACTVLVAAFAFSTIPTPAGLRLVLYCWHLAAGLVLTGMAFPGGAFEAALGDGEAAGLALGLLAGSQFLLLAQAAVGLLLLAPVPTEDRGPVEAWNDAKRHAARLIAAYEADDLHPGRAAAVLLLQGTALLLGQQAGGAEDLVLSGLTSAALAWAAMRPERLSGAGAWARSPSPARAADGRPGRSRGTGS